jgi:hypothetical protein
MFFSIKMAYRWKHDSISKMESGVIADWDRIRKNGNGNITKLIKLLNYIFKV